MSQDPSQNALAVQVRELNVPEGHLAVWALGQQGYILRGGAHVIVIDPYLSDYVSEVSDGTVRRLVPVPVLPQTLDMATLIISTHHHADHCDPLTLGPLMEASPRAGALTSYTGRRVMLEAGIAESRVYVPEVDAQLPYGDGLSVTAIPSAHYEQERDEAGNPAYLGFIIEVNGVSIYHSGDTIIYPGLAERLCSAQLDLACLPINGRDWFREQEGLVGNMDYREAAELASAAGVKVVLPGHNDMFAGNRINPAYFVDYLQANHPAQRYHFLQPGELYYYVS